jgi:hypothetical protein
MDVFSDSHCQSAVGTMPIQAAGQGVCASVPSTVSSQGAYYQAFCSNSASSNMIGWTSLLLSLLVLLAQRDC